MWNFYLVGRIEGVRGWGRWVRTVWVEDGGLECHFGRKERVFRGESEVGAVEASCCV